MKARFMTIFITLVFLGFSVSLAAHPCKHHEDKGHEHCDTIPDPVPEPDDPAVYSAELTVGDFVFFTGKLHGLDANRKGTALRGDFTLEMDLPFFPDPDSTDEEPPLIQDPDSWDYIFYYHCPLLVPTGVESFDVLAGNWKINYTGPREGPGNIYLAMRNLDVYPPPSDDYSKVDFDFDLHGVIDFGVPFLPLSIGATSTFQLTEYKLWAGAAGKGGFTCNSDDRPPLIPNSTLVIKREQ